MSAAAPSAPAAAPVSVATSQGGEPLTIARFLGHSCAVDQAGLAWCWAPPAGSLSEHEGDAVARRAPELDGALAFSKSSYFSYFLRADARVYVWGNGRHSYLGDVSKPKVIPGLERVTGLSAFGDVCVALLRNGDVWLWNDSFSSPEPGEPGVVQSNRPERVATGVRSLAPVFNDYFIGRDGRVYSGLVGHRSQVPGPQDPRSLTDCGSVTCALIAPKRVECWEGKSDPKPFELKGPGDFVALQCAGGGDIFALLSDGSVWVDHYNFGPHELHPIPTLEHVAELGLRAGTLGYPHCVKLQDGSVSCWGEGDSRQLGSGHWPKDPQFVPLLKGRDVTTPRRR